MTFVTDPRRRFGNYGEDLAVDFFRSRDFHILERNWNCRFGEIDLIAEKQNKLHFIEVKIRRSFTFGYPETSITEKKLKHLSKAVEVYLEKQVPMVRDYQVDALAILLLPEKSPEFHYIEYIL
ncbi:YraN family protein [Candidatus Uhrbacteria bacterium]|nr:YraN family protein [Candidatus Uhrbacteria bacterium]